MKPRLFPLWLLLAAVPVAAQDGLGERLAACNACHGERGEGRVANEYYPHLAGKPAGYLFDQLQAFRDGRRVYPQMNWLMRNMDDDYLAAIAGHYAGFPPRTQAVAVDVEPALAARAVRLVTQGDPARGLPPCAACHGENLAGLEPGVPALVGLPTDYVIAQLGAWRTGVRTARAPDCMAAIARALQPEELRVLGTWLAAQGHVAPQRPAPPGSFALPQACGSLQTAPGDAATADAAAAEAAPGDDAPVDDAPADDARVDAAPGGAP